MKSTYILPESPGVYQFLDSNGKIIYVGKAKNLKKRVSSYFSKTHESDKVAIMVSRIADVRFIVVETESDALLLENNMIKEYTPRYNIMLRDDKSYPWIAIRCEPFPRVNIIRNPVNDGSQHFGPYGSAKMVHTLIDLVKHLYKLRSCSLDLSGEKIAKKKYSICLEYQVGNCKAPCVGLQTASEYNESVAQIRNILRGNINVVIQHLKNQMNDFAADYRFEEAEAVKHRIFLLEKYRSRSVIVNPFINNVDVFAYEENMSFGYVNCLHIVDGAVVKSQSIEIVKRLDEDCSELLGYAITEIRRKLESESSEIIVPFYPDVQLPHVTYIVPKVGDKKKLLDLSHSNVKFFKLEKERHLENIDPDRHVSRVMETLRRDLHLSSLPVHIECFDNSNTHGTNAVAACVVFRNAKPSKSDYRHYNIKTVDGPDDYASMEEVVFRRYRRLLDEEQPLPQLIVVDGGKGQLSSAMNSLERLGLNGEIAIIGIAKRLEEIYFPGDSAPIYLDKHSESLKLIQHLRDEAHRFGISFHRRKRTKAMFKTNK